LTVSIIQPASAADAIRTTSEVENDLKTNRQEKEDLEKEKQLAKTKEDLDSRGSVENFNANFGIGASVFLFDRPHVDTAEIVGADRKVIVTRQRKHQVSPWLQANYVWDAMGSETISPGIFVGLGMGADNSFLDTFGGGFQLSFKRRQKSNSAKRESINVGIGYYVSTIQELANGIEDGKPLPADYDQIKFQNRSINGFMLSLSFGFQ
jgi:hypothetical protein